MTLNWSNAQTIGEELYDLDGDSHPLTLRFTDLHARVIALEGFVGDPKASNEGVLEAIQMVWYEEWKEDHDPSEDPYNTSGDR